MTRAITYSALINECEKGRHAAFAKKAKFLREFCSRGPEGGGSALREYTANAPSMLTELGYAPRCVHIFAHASECDMRLFSSLQRVKYHRPLRASASLPYFPPLHHGDRTLPGRAEDSVSGVGVGEGKGGTTNTNSTSTNTTHTQHEHNTNTTQTQRKHKSGHIHHKLIALLLLVLKAIRLSGTYPLTLSC